MSPCFSMCGDCCCRPPKLVEQMDLYGMLLFLQIFQAIKAPFSFSSPATGQFLFCIVPSDFMSIMEVFTLFNFPLAHMCIPSLTFLRCSAELSRQENQGLEKEMSFLEDLKKTVDDGAKGGPISWSDLIHLAGKSQQIQVNSGSFSLDFHQIYSFQGRYLCLSCYLRDASAR